jgi:hypothetical protein
MSQPTTEPEQGIAATRSATASTSCASAALSSKLRCVGDLVGHGR